MITIIIIIVKIFFKLMFTKKVVIDIKGIINKKFIKTL